MSTREKRANKSGLSATLTSIENGHTPLWPPSTPATRLVDERVANATDVISADNYRAANGTLRLLPNQHRMVRGNRVTGRSAALAIGLRPTTAATARMLSYRSQSLRNLLASTTIITSTQPDDVPFAVVDVVERWRVCCMIIGINQQPTSARLWQHCLVHPVKQVSAST